MTTDEFWNILEGLPPGEKANEALRERLNKLQPSDLIVFRRHIDEATDRAYIWDLWGAAYIIGGGCSDDGFIDFRYGLISRGRKVYEAALENPESLVDVASEDDDDGYIPNESFGYIADEIYEEKSGEEEMPRDESPCSPDPVGEQWDFDDQNLCEKKFPKLCSKFG